MSVDLYAIQDRFEAWERGGPSSYREDVAALIAEVVVLRSAAQVAVMRCWTCGGDGVARLVDDDGCVHPSVACPVCGPLRAVLGMPDLSRPAERGGTLAKGLCPTCGGEGEVEETECSACDGKGTA